MKLTASDLFDEHHLAVYRYFRRMVRPADLAQDLTQDVFLRVVQALPKYDERGQALGWIFTIARNVLLDHRQRADQAPVIVGGVETAGVDAKHVVAFGFNEALALVPAVERETLVLHELVGFSYTEIAGLCGITEDAVRSKVYRARRQVRQLLSSRLSGCRPEMRRREP